MRLCRKLCGVLLLLIAPIIVAGEEIGRLFSTPVDRAELDMLRSGIVQGTAFGSDSNLQGEQKPVAQPLYMNGLVKRSDGRTTIWVNGERLDQNGDDAVSLRSQANRQAQVKIRLDALQQNVRLKPGQAWDPASNQVIDRFYVEKKSKPREVVDDEGLDERSVPTSTGGP